MKYITIAAVFMAAGLSGCLSDLNLDPNSDFSYKGHWSAPLVHTRINLGDMVLDDSLVTADPDGLIHIVYRQDSIFSQNIYDYTQVPDQDPTLTDVTVGMADISINTNLGTFGGAKMKSVAIYSGLLTWKTTNPVTNNISIAIELLNTTLNGQPAVFTITTNGMGQNTGTINIAGLVMDLTQGTQPYNNLGFKFGIVDADGAANGTNVDLEVTYENLRLGHAIGYFGQRKVNVPSGRFNTNLSVLKNISSGLYLADPRIKLFTKSNIGLPIQINVDMLGIGQQNQAVDLGLPPFNFTGSPTIGTFASDTFYINNTTSNIADFIASIPEEIIYSGDVLMNPAGESPNDNFVTQDGAVVVGLEIDLPLELKTKNLTIEQTLYNIDFGVDKNDVDFVEELSLGFRIENGFPLEADLFFYFQDSVGNILDSTSIQLFDAAIVDANGSVIAPAKSDRFFTFTKGDIQTILKSDDIKIKVVLNTSNNGNQIVRILSDYYVDLIFGVRAKVNYNLN